MPIKFIINNMRINFLRLSGCLFVMILSHHISYAAPELLPEFQAYHSVGTRGSSYSTVVGGLAIQLSIQQIGPDRWLHLLGLYSPEQIGSHRGKAAGWIFHSPGKGLEVSIYDQKRMIVNFKGARIAFRHLEWETTHLGNKMGKVSTDVLHLGWTLGTKVMFLLGIDFATMHTPEGSLLELQLAFGGRYAF